MVTKLSAFSNSDLARNFNTITGQTVTKFTNKQVGIDRIQKVLDGTNSDLEDVLELAGLGTDDTHTDAIEPAEADAIEPAKSKEAKPKRQGKLDEVLALLRRKEGATIADLQQATGWLPHTTRAYLSKGGAAGKAATIWSEKIERDGKKLSVYRVR